MQQRITRRALLRQAGLVGGAAVLAACQPTPTPSPTPAPTQAMATTVAPQATPTAAPVQPTTAPQKITINWLDGLAVPQYRADYQNKVLFPSYKEVAPNVEIVPEQVSGWAEIEQRVLVRFAAGGGPDLAHMYYAVLNFASRGMLAALNPFLEVSNKVKGENFYLSLMKGAQYDGKTYALPHNAISQVFFYNKKYFAAAGLKDAPKTQAEVTEFAKKLSAIKKDAGFDFAFQNAISDPDTFSAYLYANGGQYVDDECQRLFFNDKMTKTLQWELDMVKSGDSSPFGAAADVANGKAAMRASVPMLVGNTLSAFPDVYPNLGAALIPAGAGGNTSYSWAHYATILSNSKVKEATWAFLEWMLSDEKVEVEFHNQQNFVPTQPRTYANKAFAEHWAWSVFAKQLAASKSSPTCVKWNSAVTEVLSPELEAVWTQQKTPAEAVATMNQKLPKVLGIS